MIKATRNRNPYEFRTLSQRARQLLAREEGFDVEFKMSLSGLHAEDIVAFANSRAGGAILIGVREVRGADGRQHLEVVGCPVGDSEKLKIVDKAHKCVPPIDLTIYVENRKDRPFYRVEIPSGPNKPYCTSGGDLQHSGGWAEQPTPSPTPACIVLGNRRG